jgi:hypothetical protein
VVDDRGSIPDRAIMRCFFFSIASRPALGPTQPPIQWVPRALTPGIKRLAFEADHPSPCSANFESEWSYTSTAWCFIKQERYILMAWCKVKHRNSFTFVMTSFSHMRATCCNLLQSPATASLSALFEIQTPSRRAAHVTATDWVRLSEGAGILVLATSVSGSPPIQLSLHFLPLRVSFWAV